MKPDLNKLETSALASIADQVLRRVDGYNHSKIGDLGDEIQELANENLKVIAYARELETEKESLTTHFAEDNTALREHITQLEKELVALRNGEFDLRLAELQDQNSSLKKQNNELEDSEANLAMLNEKLQTRADRLELIAVHHYYDKEFGEKWFRENTGYSKEETKRCFAARDESLLIHNVQLIYGNGERASKEMFETRLEIYLTARDALVKS